MKKPIVFALTAILTVGCLSGCSMLPTEEEILPPKLVSAAPVEYTTQEVTKSDLQVVLSGSGYFRSYENVSVSFEASGVLSSVDIKFNGKVKKGETIAVLRENSQYFLDLSNKKREVNNYLIEMDNAKIEIDGGGQVALLKLELEQAEYDLSLLEAGQTLASGTSLDAQKIIVEIARTAYENQLSKAKNTYQIAKYNYDVAYEEQQMLQDKYDACFVKSPISGTCIWLNSLAAGSSVTAYQEFCTITPSDSIVLTYSSPDNVSDILSIGTELSVTYNGKEYVGRVIQTPETQPSATAYGVKYMYFLEVDDIDMTNAALLDTAGDLKLVLDERKDVIAVDTYLLTENDGSYFITVLEDGLPIQKQVTIGLQNSTQTEIISGLEPGEKLIIG